MDFGLFLNPQAPADDPLADLLADLVTLTRTARDADFDLVTAGQHYLADYVQAQLIPLLGRLSADAGDMTLATGIVLLPLHHPVEIAEQLTTLDGLAGGGAICGVGAGYRDVEFDSFGVPKAERGRRLEEGIELMNRLWTQESVLFDGEFYQVEDVAITPRPDTKPPVWIAANAGRAVDRAARLGDAWFVNPHATMAEIREQKTRYDSIRKEMGKDTGVPLFRECFVAETTEQAIETARPYLEPKYQRYIDWGQDEAMEDQQDLHKPFEELAEDRFLLGTPTEVAAEIERYEAEIDANQMVLRLNWPGMPVEKAAESIRLIGDEVVPAV